MPTWQVRVRRALTLAAGFLLGLGFVALVVYFYIAGARQAALREAFLQELELPPDAFRVEQVAGGALRVSARNIVLIGEAGDTVLSAPFARLTLAPDVLGETGPIVVSDVEVRDPVLRLVQLPSGEWNIQRSLRATVDGAPIAEAEAGRPLVLTGVRIVRGRATIATPLDPGAPVPAADDVRLAQLFGTTYRVRGAQGVDATLREVRVGGGEPWQVDVADMTARLTDPALRLAQFRGRLREVPDGLAFDIQTLRTDRSVIAGAGEFRTVGEQTLLDLRLTAAPIDFRDLRWVSAAVPAEGEARGVLEARTLAGGRTLWAVRDLELLALDSRVAGRLTVLTGGGAPVVFRDTDLLLDPLDLRVAEAFGFGEQVPYLGQLRGRLATEGEVADFEGPLTVDVVASVVPRDLPLTPPSTIAAQGSLSLDADFTARADDLLVSARPLFLAALRPILPEQEEWLRGTLRGGIRVSGTPGDLRFTEGDLTYEVANAPPTRLAGVSGFAVQDPDLRWEITAVAQPLALATVADFFPALPFRATALSGPVELAGTAEAVRFNVNLRGDVGGFTAQGSFAFGDPASFRVAGRLNALQPARLLRQEVPLAGPVSGPFVVEGTTRDFRFDVDFTQALGRFALDGRVRLPEGVSPIFEAQGEVENFRIGTLIGRTGLFASPLTGRLQVAGGGFQPYTFDVALAGPDALLDVDGWYSPTAIPSYAASGRVAGLNLRLVPGLEEVPPTNLVAAFSVQGEGLTLEAVAGQLAIDATGSVVGGVPLQAGVARVAAVGGVLRVDTLAVAAAGARLEAAGAWGLTRPAERPLSFVLSAADLTEVTPVIRAMRRIEPQLTGSFTVAGTVAGTVRNPVIDVRGRGRNLRYDGWRAGTLALAVDAELTPAGWAGEVDLDATAVVLQATEQFEAIRLQASGAPQAVVVSLAARRDRFTELTASGTLELAEGTPTGVALETLGVRVDASRWSLARPATVRWGEVTGIEVVDLVLDRAGAQEGRIEVDGRIPPEGDLGMRVVATNVDVGELRRLFPATVPIDGVLTLDATLVGPPGAPVVAVDARLDGLRYLDARAEAISLSARYAAGSLIADAGVWEGGVQVARGEGTIPMQLTFAELTPRIQLLDEQPVSARVVADSLPMGLIAAAAPFVSAGTGVLAGEFTVGGLLGSPELAGTARISRGALTVDNLNVRFEEIEGVLALVGQSIEIQSLTARSLGGASVSGRITLDDRTRPLLDLTASFNQFRAINLADVATVALSGSVALAGRYPTPTLTGRVEATNGNITLPTVDDEVFEIGFVDFGEVVGDALPTDALEPTFVDLVRIQGLEVTVGDGVWAVSPAIRVQIAGDLLVSRFGPENWQVFGDLGARRGTYTLAVGPLVREFDVVSGRIEFFGTPDLNPALDIVAQHRVRASGPGATGILNILVNVTGSVQFPRISLSTDTQPPLPESEILSYLIFGRPTFALGEVGGGLAQQILVQEVAGGLLANQIEQLIRQAGLPFDYIRVRGRPSPTEFVADPLGSTVLEVGWQVVPNVFLSVEWAVGVIFDGALGENWGASIEWQIDPRWSTRFAWEPLRRDPLLRRQFSTELNRQFSVDLRRRWEYGLTPDTADQSLPEVPADDSGSPPLPPVPAPPPAPAQGEARGSGAPAATAPRASPTSGPPR